MRSIVYLLLAVLSGMLLSGATDSRWGSGVRGALSGVSGRGSDKGVRGVRDRLSAGVSGAASGWREKAAQLGRTPRPDTPLSRLRDRLSEGVRGVRRKVSGQREGDDRTQGWGPDGRSRIQMMIRRPDGQARYVDHWDGDPYPHLEPGEELFHIGEHGQAQPSNWTYEDQQEAADSAEPTGSVCPHCHGTRLHPGQPGGRAVAPDTPCPWCTKDQTVRTELADGTVEYSSWWANQPLGSPETYEAIGARVSIEDRETGALTEYTRPRQSTGGTEGDHDMTTTESPTTAGADMTLPQYRQFLQATKTRALSEHEDAQALQQRLAQWSHTVREATEGFAAMHADPQTVREGHEVAEWAHISKEVVLNATRLLNELTEKIQAALDGLRRHDMVQEAHNSGVHLDRTAYDGA